MSILLIVRCAAVAALLLFVALPIVYVKNYIKVPPNEVAVFTGRGTPKVVRGGARFRVPGIERVDIMSLEPFNVSINLQNALSNNGVPVNVEAVGLVRIGSADEAVQTAVQRFLTSDLNDLQRQINEILAGSLRGITATMTVEDLNSNRDTMARSVVEEAGSDLARIGMEVDVLKIAGISDHNGYLESLGQRRIAEVKRDATVGTAEAERDAQIQSAKARQAGSVAQAEAETAIATANQRRDVELARLRAQTEAENAQADQAGPLANARAQKDVGIATEQAEAARVQARIEVEQRRAEQAQAALQADVIAPAEAQRQADIARAEGQRQADDPGRPSRRRRPQSGRRRDAGGTPGRGRRHQGAAGGRGRRQEGDCGRTQHLLARGGPPADPARRAGFGGEGHRGGRDAAVGDRAALNHRRRVRCPGRGRRPPRHQPTGGGEDRGGIAAPRVSTWPRCSIAATRRLPRSRPPPRPIRTVIPSGDCIHPESHRPEINSTPGAYWRR